MGYKIESPLFITAESVGASHKRERVFVLAHAVRSDGQPRAGRQRVLDVREAVADAERADAGTGVEQVTSTGCGRNRPAIDGDDLADAERSGSRGERVSRRGSKRGTEAGRAGEAVGDPICTRTNALAAGSRSRDSVGESSLFAPGPGADWGAIHEHLWPAIEPGFRCVVDGRPVVVDSFRADQLRCSGNAVVPLCAAVAFVELVRRVIASN